MVSRKTTYVTPDLKYQMVYTPQRVYGRTTHLAKFELMKWCDTRGDLGDAYITIHGYTTNYKPSSAFPLQNKIEEVMQMLVTDYNVEEWFAKLDAKHGKEQA